MAERILTYSCVEQLYARDSIFLNEYADVIHITATATLRRGLVKANQSGRWIEAPILAFGQLVKYIGDGWFRSDTLLKQSIFLTNAYEEYAKQPQNPQLFAAFDKNQQELLLTLRALIEAGVTYTEAAKQLKKLSKEESMLLELWRRLSEHRSVSQYDNWFEQFQTKNNTDNMIADILIKTLTDSYTSKTKRKGNNAIPYVVDQKTLKKLEKDSKDDPKKFQRAVSKLKAAEVVEQTFKKRKVLVFHGFYFITPVQQRFLEALKASGIEIVHVIHYDERYPEIFETVRRFLPMQQSEKLSSYEGSINTMAIRFAKVLQGDFEKMPTVLNNEYLVFSHLYQFKEYVMSEKNKEERIISPRATAIEKYLVGLTTASTAELKDYPIGQFLIDIHRLNTSTYNMDKEKYDHEETIDRQLLLRIFNSGYLFIPGKNGEVIQGKTLVKDLMKLQKRFPLCKTFENWECELTGFLIHKEQLEQSMSPPEAKRTRNTELYMYTNRDVGYYNVSFEKIQIILDGLMLLRDFYQGLYNGTQLSIGDYIEQLDQFMKQRLEPHIGNKDREIAEKVMEQIHQLEQDDFDGINRRDIIKGLQFFLSHSEKQSDAVEKVDDGNDSAQQRSINPLIDADGLIFEDNRHVHLAFMDNKALPIVQNVSLWPLQEETIEELCQMKNGNTLEQLQIRKKMAGSITSYLLYLTMQKATNVKISLVRNVEDEHHLEPSFYLKLMDLKQGTYKIESNEQLAVQYAGEATKRTFSASKREANYILDQTYLACQRRFMLSYMLQNRPDFSQDFHLGFIYQGFVQYFNALAKGKKESQIRQLVDDMFPQWTATKKDILYRDCGEYGLKDSMVDGETYKTMWRPLSLIGLPLFKNLENKKYVTSNAKCMYCPFKLQCRESGKEPEENDNF